MMTRRIWLSCALIAAGGTVAVVLVASPEADIQQTPQPGRVVWQAKRLNLNTAPAEELQKLPRLSAASAQAIVEARDKSKFKDWNDFVARRVVPSFAYDEIRILVTF